MIPKIQGFAGTPSRIRELKSGVKLPPEKADIPGYELKPETLSRDGHKDIPILQGMPG